MPAPVCRAWRKPRPAGGRKSERRLKPPLPRLRLRLRLRLRRQQLRRQQLRRTRLRLRTTSGASIGGEHRGRVSGAASEACIGGEHRGRHRWRPRLALLGLARLTFWLALALHRLASPRLASPRSGRLARLARLASLALASARLARLSPHPRLALPRLASLTSISSLTLALHRLARPRIAPLRSPRLTPPRLGEPRLASLASALANRAPVVASSIQRLQQKGSRWRRIPHRFFRVQPGFTQGGLTGGIPHCQQ